MKEEVETQKWKYHPMTDGVRWSEHCADTLEKIWNRIPSVLGHVLATVVIFVFGATLKGDWILIMVHFLRQMGRSVTGDAEPVANENQTLPFTWDDFTLERLHLQGWPSFWLYSAIGSYSMYFILGGLIHWYFYVRQRHKAHEWKIQPDKFLPPNLELHEIFWGSIALFICSGITGGIACYATNNGPLLKIYYDWTEYGWWWIFLQIPVIFIYQDYATYWLHRTYHFPFLYKHFHKLHHTYKQPTAFSVTAIHPVEIVHIQITLLLPIFIIPLHWAPFYGVVLYTYYHAILDHSGVAFKAFWWQPWQPDAAFHDNHHQYFHVNFGFNIKYWDKLHGTERKKDRMYNEHIFYGTGTSLSDVPEDVLRKEIEERKTENPLAYKDNKNEYELTDNDLQSRKKKMK